MLNEVCVRRRSSKSGSDIELRCDCPPNGVTNDGRALRIGHAEIGEHQSVDDGVHGGGHGDAGGQRHDRKDREERRGDQTGDGESQTHARDA